MKKLPSKFEGILELLDDGRFHELAELQEETQLNKNQTRTIVEFLAEYGFAEMNKGNNKVRISKAAKKLLAQTTT